MRLRNLAAFVLAFALSIPFLLPYDLLLERGIRVYAPQLAGRFEWDETSFRFPRTLHLEGLRYYASPSSVLALPRIDLTPAFSILSGRPGGSLSGSGALGTYQIDLATEDDNSKKLGARVEFSLDAASARTLGIPLSKGHGTITADLTRAASEGAPWSGKIRVEAVSLAVKKMNILAAELPPITINDLKAEAQIAADRLIVTSFETKGGNLSLGVTGSVSFASPLSNSPLALTLQARPDASFLEALGEKGKNALRAAGPEGAFAISIGGTLASPAPRFGN